MGWHRCREGADFLILFFFSWLEGTSEGTSTAVVVVRTPLVGCPPPQLFFLWRLLALDWLTG